MSGLARDETAEPVLREQIPCREQRQGKNNFPSPADRGQNWQLYSVDPYSVESVNHVGSIHKHKYIYICFFD